MCGEKGDRIQETVFRPDLPTDHPASLEAMRGTAQMDTDVRALTTKSSKADEMVRKEFSRKGAKIRRNKQKTLTAKCLRRTA
jgi:hypothetical protein